MNRKPNVLLIVTDQHRYDALGCMGNPHIETPNIDFIASRGTVFDRAYTPCPSCIPARASLMTGLSPWSTGILGMGEGQGPMGTGFDFTIPGELGRAGWHTYGIGKMHFFPQRSLNGFHSTILDESGRRDDPYFISDYERWFRMVCPDDRRINEHGIGWNSWMAHPRDDEYLHPTNWTAREGLRFIEEKDPSKPFFLKLSFARPHSPYDPPRSYWDLYNDRNVPETAVGEWAACNDLPADAARDDAWRGRRAEYEIKRARRAYYASITHIDHQIGRVIQALRKIEQLNNTLIIFLSDHGDMLGDHNLWRKTYAYEASARVPLVIKLPEELSNQSRQLPGRIDTVVGLEDIMPTILDICNVSVPDSCDGSTLLPLLNGQSDAVRDYYHGEHSRCYGDEQEMQFLTDDRRKYIWFPLTGDEQYFDLEKDPHELSDLSDQPEYRDEIEVWRERLESVFRKRSLTIGRDSRGKFIRRDKGKPYKSPAYSARKKKAGFDWESYQSPPPGFIGTDRDE